MRILYVSMDHGAYADRSHEVKVAEVMARAGHDVHLVVERPPKWSLQSPMPENMTVQVEPVNDARQADGIADRIGSGMGASVGFASSVSGAPILAAWKKRTGKPVVAQVLDVPLWRLEWGKGGPWLAQWEPWFRALLEMDRLVVNTRQTAEDLSEAARMYGAAPSPVPVTVVYYGIDTEAADAAEVVELPDNGHRGWFTGVSRLVPYKGFDLAISALSLIDADVRPGYCVIGDGEDAHRLLQLTQWANARTIFAGGVPDATKFGLIKASDYGLLLAMNRHIPLQFPVEAIYCGKPCIVADTPINRERFGKDGEHGVYYVNPFDTRHVAETIAWMQGAEVVDVEADREWVRQNRSFTSHAKGVLEVLEGLAK